jgi:hypothetical protein
MTTVQLPDLTGLRRFVTLVDITEIASHSDGAAAYFRTFDAGDDATLLVYAPTDDAGWVQWLLERILGQAGATTERCADVRVCLTEDDDDAWLHFARHSHAALGSDRAGWVRVRRPVYRWEDLAALREQAERLWGRRDPGAAYAYEDAMAHLLQRGWTSEFHVRMGSVPEPSLARAVEAFARELPPRPRILHVGNFLGVSLSYLLHWATARAGAIVSVDPDIPHRGVQRPQRAVCDLLTHFGLTEGHLLICGYSLDKTLSNDSVVFEGYDPAAQWGREAAPENVLPGLVASGQSFDAAFMDGNHDPAYLRREVAEVTRLLNPGSLLVLDDVDEAWQQIRQVFDEVAGDDWPYEPVLADGRIGILRRLPGDHSRNSTNSR